MAISQEFLEQLRSQCDITALCGEYVNLRRSGTTAKGLCPFHNEKTPSFTVFADTSSFYCFGCQAGGDAITFIRMIEKLDYVEAVKFLAAREGLTMPEDGAFDGLAHAKNRIREQNREAARFFYHELYSPDGRQALEYLHARGLTDETIGAFGLGWSPSGWDKLSKHLRALGYNDDEIIGANLAIKNKYGNLTDFFRERVMFPIIDLQGTVVGFGGRTMQKDHGGRKYINTNNTLVYKKSNNLYGLNFAKKAKSDTLIVVEGFMDVITMSQAGIKNAVASQGTAFTSEQARLVSHYAKRVILSQDGDAAGQQAIRRSIPILKATGLDVRVLTIPENLDPDEYIRKYGVYDFNKRVEQCGSDVDFSIEEIRAKYDVATDDGKIGFLREVCPLLAGLSSIEREIYSTKLATELGVDKNAIVEQVNTGRRKKEYAEKRERFRQIEADISGKGDKLNPERKRNIRAANAEDAMLTTLLTNPDYIKTARELIKPEQMVTSLNRTIYKVILTLFENGVRPTVTAMAQSLSPAELGAVSGLINSRIAMQTGEDELRGFIDIILEEGGKITASQVSEKSAEELNEYLKSLRKKKQ